LINPKIALIAVAVVCGVTSSANAEHRHHRDSSLRSAQITCDMRGCYDHAVQPRRHHFEAHTDTRRRIDANGNGVVLGGRPAGCPYEFCGCEASRYVFGKIRAELNLASNWIRHFPRTMPATGMAAVRNHHVMILIRHVGGSDWMVHDGNSGNHVTREHVRSIAGYIVVNPHGTRIARD